MAIAQPALSCPIRFSLGTFTSSKNVSQKGDFPDIRVIGFVLTPAGVSTKPITLISGKSPFCETFFDDVKVPKENLIGQLNAGQH